MNNVRDFHLARDKHWYRIPVTSVERALKRTWPPLRIAFYHTKIFGDWSYSIRFYTDILNIERVTRAQLFPDDPLSPISEKEYYKLTLAPLKSLPYPILSRRYRRIVFIPTTWAKFTSAMEVNDLYDGSALEDRMWAYLKQTKIPAERQEFVAVKNRNYFLDFSIYCTNGKINIETDGDFWHHNPFRAQQDNIRNNDLVSAGWRILRFSQNQILKQMEQYCLPKILDGVNHLGGVTPLPEIRSPFRSKTPNKIQLFDK